MSEHRIDLFTRALATANLALRFGAVNRVTAHPDGRPESDTTHTVMLALIVPELALAEGLDVGLAVQFAVVHDLAEAYAGDTNTARELDAEARARKEEKERQAVQRIEQDLGRDSWVVMILRRYEEQKEPEARLVRYVDKILPKLTHSLNEGRALMAMGMSLEELKANHEAQRAKLRASYPELSSVASLFVDATSAAEKALQKGATSFADTPWSSTSRRDEDPFWAKLEHMTPAELHGLMADACEQSRQILEQHKSTFDATVSGETMRRVIGTTNVDIAANSCRNSTK